MRPLRRRQFAAAIGSNQQDGANPKRSYVAGLNHKSDFSLDELAGTIQRMIPQAPSLSHGSQPSCLGSHYYRLWQFDLTRLPIIKYFELTVSTQS